MFKLVLLFPLFVFLITGILDAAREFWSTFQDEKRQPFCKVAVKTLIISTCLTSIIFAIAFLS
jgi:hypothetical protein